MRCRPCPHSGFVSPPAQQPQIRQQLSLALLAVVAQQLIPGVDGVNRYPALEIMMATDAVRNLIRRGEDHQLRSQISIGRAEGMMTMEQCLPNWCAGAHLARDCVRALLPSRRSAAIPGNLGSSQASRIGRVSAQRTQPMYSTMIKLTRSSTSCRGLGWSIAS